MCWLVKVAFVIPRHLLADATQSRELQERKPKLMVSQSGFYTQMDKQPKNIMPSVPSIGWESGDI